MAINYNSMIKSEKELSKSIINYVSFCEEVHTKLWNKIKEGIDYNQIIDSIERKIKKSDYMESDLIDECIWIISKDTPRANHLRKIVSFIYQTKDIERAISYSLTIIKTISRNNLEINKLKNIEKIVIDYLKLISSFIKLYKDKKENDKFEKAEELTLVFQKSSHEVSKKIKKEINIEKYLAINIIIKNIESTVERLKSIFAIVNYNEENK